MNYPQAPLAAPELATSIDRTVNPGAEILIETAGPDNQPTVAGWAQVQANGSLTGFSMFRIGTPGNQQEAVVPLENRTPSSFLLSYDQTGGFVTGIAVANMAASPATVPVILRDDTGAQLATTSLTLPAMGHTAFLLTDQLPQAAQLRGPWNSRFRLAARSA